MKLKEIMSHPVQTVSEDATLARVARLMLDKGIGAVPVVDGDGKLVGLITHSDFVSKEKAVPFSRYHVPTLLGQFSLKDDMEEAYEKAKSIPARDIMKAGPLTLTGDDTVRTFLESISKYNLTHIPILEEGELVGIVARQDLLKMIAGE
jgi:CBS domain-containing protein